jgi:hypothetical protein
MSAELQLRARLARAAGDLQRHQVDAVVGAQDLIVDQGDDVLVEDFLLAVGQVLEPAEGVGDGVVAQLVAQLLQLFAERVTARQLAQDDLRRGQADRLRGHDLVGRRVLQQAVLVDARFVGEGVGADDRLVGLHDEAGHRGDQAGGADDVLGAMPVCTASGRGGCAAP